MCKWYVCVSKGLYLYYSYMTLYMLVYTSVYMMCYMSFYMCLDDVYTCTVFFIDDLLYYMLYVCSYYCYSLLLTLCYMMSNLFVICLFL